MTAAMDAFLEEARGVSIAAALSSLPLGGLRRGTREWVGACPVGRSNSKRPDGFAIHPAKGVWNCRPCGVGGHDAIGLAAHCLGLDEKRRDDLFVACAAVLGRPAPDGAGESATALEARKARTAALRAENEARAAREAQDAEAYRERERAKARGKWLAGRSSGPHRAYLAARLGIAVRALPDAPLLRSIAAEPYWHGTDAAGRPIAIHEGPAMVAPFVDLSGQVIGCHLTFIDLSVPRRCRPRLLDATGDLLPTKKMRGTKKGGLIPLIGFLHTPPGAGLIWMGEEDPKPEWLIRPDPSRRRLVMGEGIENVLAVAIAEGPREDTLYAAAGDLGNLAGPAAKDTSFPHPSLRTAPDARGRSRPVRVPGPVPREGQGAEEAAQAPPFSTEILLVADGDSERWATGAAMARALARLGQAGARVAIAWPPPGRDFADLLLGYSADALEEA